MTFAQHAVDHSVDWDAFRQDIKATISRHDIQLYSNTPVEVVAEYVTDCLIAHNCAVARRDQWYDDHNAAWRDRSQLELFDNN